MLADCILNLSISWYVCSNFPKAVNPLWKRAVARNFGLLWWFGVINLESTGLSRLPLTVNQSLDNYRRWKHRLRISISGMHFEGSFYTPPGGMELFTPYLQIFQRTQNHRPLEPENHSSFSEIMHVLTHQLFLKKAYHTYLLIHTTGPTNRAQSPRQPISYQPSLRKSIHMVLSNDPKLCTAHVRCGLTA